MNDLATLEPVIRELTRESIAENTRLTYRNALQKIDEWLAGMELTDALLAAYVSHLYQQGYASQSARVAMAAVSFRYRLRGEWSPAGPATRRVSVGYRRMAKGRGSKGRAKGIPWMDALRMARVSEEDGSLRGIRDAAIISIASDAMLRCSEIQAIQVEHITETAVGGTVYIAHSKTDPFGNGATLFLGEETVRRVKRWIDKAWIADGPVFRGIKGKVVLDHSLNLRNITKIVKKRAKDAGIEETVSTHSFRVGSAQCLAEQGAGVVEMQTAGRWRSPQMPARYAEGAMAERNAVARYRYGVETARG